MKLVFLGTSAGTPTKQRNVTALALEHLEAKAWYLFDCGEGTQHQLLHTRHSLAKLRAIFITHVHGDHTFGLPGLLASASMAGRTEPLTIVAPAPLETFIRSALEITQSWLTFELQFVDVAEHGFTWQDDTIRVAVAELSHRVPCFAYVVTEKRLERSLLVDRLSADDIPAGPLWGRIHRGEDLVLEDGRHINSDDYVAIRRQPRKIIIGGDNDTPELLREACTDAHLLVHEATYTQAVSDHVGPEPQHSSAEQVARFAESVNLPNLILTHFSSRYQFAHKSAPLIDEIEQEARRFYRGNLQLARDFAEFELRKDFRLVKTGHDDPDV
ncbi:MAG: ribonuclease Z [Cellvibrio sp.]|jgi:Metal-dependent hydrolases of the beta-lactamase superfamily III